MRIFHGKQKVLNSGMIFLVGKHQFLVCSIDDSQCENYLDEVLQKKKLASCTEVYL